MIEEEIPAWAKRLIASVDVLHDKVDAVNEKVDQLTIRATNMQIAMANRAAFNSMQPLLPLVTLTQPQYAPIQRLTETNTLSAEELRGRLAELGIVVPVGMERETLVNMLQLVLVHA